jgi:apoptotic chromatin condensation inducer in the nucleus
MLSTSGDVKALWMPMIKTHCYVIFGNVAGAAAARDATWQLQWPASNPKRLAPEFVSVGEAERAIGTGAGNPDFKVARTKEDATEEEEAVEQAAAVEAAPPVAEALRAAAASEKSGGKRDSGAALVMGPGGVKDLRELLTRRHSKDAAGEAPGSGHAALARREDPPPRYASRSIDELFRKTEGKPCIYWLPLTEEEVATKKARAEEAVAGDAAPMAS